MRSEVRGYPGCRDTVWCSSRRNSVLDRYVVLARGAATDYITQPAVWLAARALVPPEVLCINCYRRPVQACKIGAAYHTTGSKDSDNSIVGVPSFTSQSTRLHSVSHGIFAGLVHVGHDHHPPPNGRASGEPLMAARRHGRRGARSLFVTAGRLLMSFLFTGAGPGTARKIATHFAGCQRLPLRDQR